MGWKTFWRPTIRPWMHSFRENSAHQWIHLEFHLTDLPTWRWKCGGIHKIHISHLSWSWKVFFYMADPIVTPKRDNPINNGHLLITWTLTKFSNRASCSINQRYVSLSRLPFQYRHVPKVSKHPISHVSPRSVRPVHPWVKLQLVRKLSIFVLICIYRLIYFYLVKQLTDLLHNWVII